MIAKAIDICGIDSREVFALAGLDPDKMYDANARYSFDGMSRLWKLAAELTGDPCIGLKAARHWHPTSLHALGYSWLASETLHKALQRAVKYVRLVSAPYEFVLLEQGDEVRLVFSDTEEDQSEDEETDSGLAVVVGMCRTCYGDDFRPLHVNMTRNRPDCAAEFDDFFRSPITYLAAENSISFSRHDLDKRLPTANADLARSSDLIVADYLARLDKGNIIAQVTTKIVEQLPSGEITELSVAQSLNMSLRSLQRKLSGEGVTYKALLEATRRELATQYLSSSRYTINEATYLLGFSEPSNFSRAFRRWTGESPSSYRSTH
jgi:AraC-like DNA-binding protein